LLVLERRAVHDELLVHEIRAEDHLFSTRMTPFGRVSA